MFTVELATLDPGQGVAELVDYRLLSSVLARVHWELNVLRAWQCQPRFYIDQAIGTVFDTLLRPGVDDDRVREVIRLLRATPEILATGSTNLTGHAVAEFARLAIGELIDIEARLASLCQALAATAPALRIELEECSQQAALAFVRFRDSLAAALPSMAPWLPIGSDQYQWFLHRVAVLPFSPDQLLAIGVAELDRAITLEHLEVHRNQIAGHPTPEMPASIDIQIALEAELELQVRAFYVNQALLSQPESLAHYRIAATPAYLEPLRFLGVTDDLTSPSRLQENGISYAPAPGADLPYFYAANAIDPRAGIIHEGAHYQQLALSWRHERPLRRHFYDSASNEGIAFYNEEMLLAAGLFQDAPATRAIIYNFMRLRALRVEVDVGLATGRLTIAAAAKYLADNVPMDAQTAEQEAADFAEGPGQAISYQIGKTQILALIADAVRLGGAGTSLRELHDYLWLNGNVPIALCRWELLGLEDELAEIGVVIPRD